MEYATRMWSRFISFKHRGTGTKIRSSVLYKGIKMPGVLTEVQMAAHADDTTLYAVDLVSLKHVFDRYIASLVNSQGRN
jgi:hypothetical protein